MSVLVVGSIALDTVKTPVEEHADQLGGSASYAAVGASFFSPVNWSEWSATIFPQSEFEFWKSRNIDATGVQQIAGKTFRWSGEYAWDHQHPGDTIGSAQCLRTFQAGAAGIFSGNGIRAPGQHRAVAPIACARSDAAAPFCRRRHDGSLDRDDAQGSRRAPAAGRLAHFERQRSAADDQRNEPDQSRAGDPANRPEVCRSKERRTRCAAFRTGRFFQLRRISAWKTSTIRPARGIHLPVGWQVIWPAMARVKLISLCFAGRSFMGACWQVSTWKPSALSGYVA